MEALWVHLASDDGGDEGDAAEVRLPWESLDADEEQCFKQ